MSQIQFNDKLKQILILLQNTFSCNDNEIRKNAEKTLKKYSENPVSFIQEVIVCLTIDSKIINDQLKKSIAIYIKNLIYDKYEILKKNEEITIIKILSNIQLNNNLDITICSHLNNALVKLFSSNNIIDDKELIINYIKEYTLFQLNQKEKNIIQSYNNLNLFKNVFITKSLQVNNIETIFEEIIKLFDNLFQIYKNDLGNLEINSINLFSEIYDFMYLLIIKLKFIDEKEFTKRLILLFSKYGNFVYEIISTNKNNESQNPIIYICQNKELSQKMNILKAKCFQFISAIIQYLGESIKEENLINITSSIIKLTVNSLENLINDYINLLDNLIVDDDPLNIIIYNMIIFLTRGLIREPIKSNFEHLVFNFLLNVIFPFLISSKKDEEELIENPEEYNTYLNDLISNFKIKNYKVSISFLIVKILDNFVEQKIICISFCLQLLDYILKIENNENISKEKYYLLFNLNLNQYYILNKERISNEKLIDLLLLIIIILKDNIIKSKKNILFLREIVLNYFSKFNNINSLIIKNKLCYFYSNYFIHLYDENDNNNKNIITNIFLFLLQQIINPKENCLSYQSSNAIIFMLNKIEKNELLNSLINENLSKLIILINDDKNDNYMFFELLEEISEYNQINELIMLPFISETIKKIEKDINNSSNLKNSNSQIIFGKCFNIIINILKKNPIHEDRINEFENIIENLFTYLKEPEKIDFDDEIINIISEEIKNLNKITSLSIKLLQFLIPIIKKEEEIDDSIYNFLIYFFKIDFENNYNFIYKEQDLFFQIINNLLYNDIDSVFNDFYEFNLTKVFVILNKKLTSIQIKEICNQLYSKIYFQLPEDNEDDFFEVDVNKVNFAIFSTICSCMLNYPSLISNFIEENSTLSFYELMEKCLEIKYYKIDLGKNIILGLLNMIMTNQYNENKIIITILNLIFKYIIRQKKEENSYIKKLMKNDFNCNFINENYDDDNIEENNKNNIEESEEKEDNESNGNFHTQNLALSLNWLPNNKLDEFEIFFQCIYNLNDNIKNQFLNNLSEYEKLMFNDCIHTRRIPIEYKNIKLTIPRRTVRIKKNK